MTVTDAVVQASSFQPVQSAHQQTRLPLSKVQHVVSDAFQKRELVVTAPCLPQFLSLGVCQLHSQAIGWGWPA